MLHESKERFCSLVENTTDWIWEINEHTRYTYASPQVHELLGYEPDEMIGKTPFDVMTPEDQLHVRTQFVEIAGRQDIFFGLENINMHKDGHTVILETSGVPIFGSDGSFKGYRGIDRDITERKQAESALRRSEESLAEAQRVSHLENWDWNIVDNELNWSDKIYRIFGLKPQEFGATYDAFLNYIHPDDREFVRNSVNGSLYEKLPYSINHRIVLPSGTVRIVHEDAEVIFDEKGKPVRMIGTVQNITEVKKMEETLLQSEKLKAMGMITAGIAHDFNNILAVISGSTQILEMDNEDNKGLMRTLRIIAKASDDGAEIVRRMSMFAQQKQETSGLLPVDIKEVLKQAIEFVKPRWMNIAKASGINYDINDDGLMEVPVIMGIESELREVFINMMNNAMDAMKKGGCLSFRTWQKEENIFISISDTGEGMSEEVKRRVFEPFYTTKREKGSGLGMSMSHGIIERHGGEIEVNSELEKGTTFTLRFPNAELPVHQTEAPVEDQKIMAKDLRVLVVDDKEDIRSLLDKFFTNNGHMVKTVDSGSRAVEVLKVETFDIVMCDLVMPEMSGHEVIEELNRLEKRPKIGMMTGWSEKVESEDENELNVDFIIRKPFKFSALITHINEAFSMDG